MVTTIVTLPVVCPFRLGTGHACPGCGLTRAIGSLVRGDVSLSIRYHPIAILLVAQVAIASILLARQPERSVNDFVTEHRRWIYANVVMLIVVWALRWRFGMLDLVLDRA